MPLNRTTLLSSCLIIIVLAFSGCSALINHYQKVNIISSTSGAEIIYPVEGVKDTPLNRQYDKKRVYHTVAVKKDGYITTNYAFGLNKRSPGFILFLIGGSSLLNRSFTGNQIVPPLASCENRKNNEKYLIMNDAVIDTGENFAWHLHKSIKDYAFDKFKVTKYMLEHSGFGKKDNYQVDNVIFERVLNKSLKKMNFTDTSKTVFPAVANTNHLNATIKKLVVHEVQDADAEIEARPNNTSFTAYVAPTQLFSIELEIEWEVLDYYKQKLYTTTTTAISDLYAYNQKSRTYTYENFVTNAMENNVERSLQKIRKELADSGYLQVSATTDNTLSALAISKPVKTENGRMNDYLRSSVILKVEKGHGSGVVISADGYLLTAYHVVAGAKKIEVIFYNGDTAIAEVIRKNDASDLALIKVNKKDLTPLLIGDGSDPEPGTDVWAIGAPKTVELGQSVSKGVLSALRTANGIHYLQTDVGINKGNSGGPLINKEGLILGIVTAKLISIGTEGVAFAISSKEIFDKLKLQYQ